jgi:hypothetical protein
VDGERGHGAGLALVDEQGAAARLSRASTAPRPAPGVMRYRLSRALASALASPSRHRTRRRR